FHYGNYDVRVLRGMKRRLGKEHTMLLDRVLGSCRNVLSVIHQHCYFPTYSNGLKDVTSFLGYRFNNPIKSGLRSIIFRERWERTADDALKEALIEYNREDCEALKTICAFLSNSAALATERSTVPGRNEEVMSTDSLRKVGEGSRPIFRKAE